MARLTKQLIFGGIYLVIFVLVGWGLYRLFVPAPSCTDGVQNGQEEGVDCGALACGRLCAPSLRPLTVLPSQLIAYASGSYDVLGILDNPNPTYGAAKVDYVLTVSDAAGQALATRRGSTYVNALEKRQLVFSFPNLAGQPTRADLQVSTATLEWARLDVAGGNPVDLAIRRDQLTPGPKNLHYQATVTNRSQYDFDTVDLVVLVRNAQGDQVAVGATTVNTLKAGEERGFVVDWPFQISGAVNAQALATTNVFNNDNYLRTHGNPQRF